MALTVSLTCTTCSATNAPGVALCGYCHHPVLLSAYLASRVFFQGRYNLVERLGTGGFGEVYRATDTQRAYASVAIKEICLRGLSSTSLMEATDSFKREAELLSQLSHSHLPHLYEHIRESEQWYLIMDFVEGQTLEKYQMLAPRKRLPLGEIFVIGLQLCDVLEYLHSQHPPIVFRDLKPANIIRSPEGKIYLIDFGIARFFKPGQSKDTVPLGSIGYAAPEQYGRAQTTPRADIYSLGAVLHQLFTGKDPTETPLRFVSLRAANTAEPGSLTSSMVSVLMDSFGDLINSMVEIDISKRPADITIVKQELRNLDKMWSEIVRSYFRPRVPQAYLR